MCLLVFLTLAFSVSSYYAPPLTILSSTKPLGNGYIFVAPRSDAYTYSNGLEIFNSNGNLIWFYKIPKTQYGSDFRTQYYLGQQVLTWWQGSNIENDGTSCGTGYIYDNKFLPIIQVNAANGYCMDAHEFLITPQNTALIITYEIVTVDLRFMGGFSNQKVVNNIIQEIDISTGNLLFQWNSANHVFYTDSYFPLPGRASRLWQWFHMNSVKLDYDGNLLINSRNTWGVYKVNRVTGNIIWTLGGKSNNFLLLAGGGQIFNAAGQMFAWQHDPESLGNGFYSIFDNEFHPGMESQLPYTRTIFISLDEMNHVATLLNSYAQPNRLISRFQGNMQLTQENSFLVGWGGLPYISAFYNNSLIFHAKFPSGVQTNRAYFLPFRF